MVTLIIYLIGILVSYACTTRFFYYVMHDQLNTNIRMICLVASFLSWLMAGLVLGGFFCCWLVNSRFFRFFEPRRKDLDLL